MCLYPKLIYNRKYKSNKTNGGNVPVCYDERLRYVTAACGYCLECRQQKARQWQIRMSEELRENPNAYFLTLTIDDTNYKLLKNDCKEKTENGIATLAIRRFLERIRRDTGKSIKHWFITEMGHENSKRLHLHGITWGIGTDELVKKHWKYGFVFIGTYVNESTASYIVKYMYKEDKDNKDFIGKVLCSKGLGIGYIKRADSNNNKFKNENTNVTYRLRNGIKLNLPTYYRNKLLSEEEREKLWIQKLNKGEVYVCGEKVSIDDEKGYQNLLEYHRERAKRLLNEDERDWNKAKYLKRLSKQRKKYRE